MPLNENRQVAEGDVGSLQCNDKKDSLQPLRDVDGLDVIIWNGFRDLSRYYFTLHCPMRRDTCFLPLSGTIERPKTRGGGGGTPLYKPYR